MLETELNWVLLSWQRQEDGAGVPQHLNKEQRVLTPVKDTEILQISLLVLYYVNYTTRTDFPQTRFSSHRF